MPPDPNAGEFCVHEPGVWILTGRKAVPYSINLRSDHPSAEAIRELWCQAEQLEDSPSMAALDYPPHLTLAVMDDIAQPQLMQTVSAVFSGHAALTLQFSSLSFFQAPHAIVIYAAPDQNSTLSQLHDQLHQALPPDLCRRNYLPGIWVPHCSLATRVDVRRLDSAKAFIASDIAPFSVTFDVADCAAFPPVDVLQEHRLKL